MSFEFIKGKLVFLLGSTLFAYGCQSHRTIQVLTYAQAKKLGQEYVQRYNPRKTHPEWPVRLLGPPASSTRLLRTNPKRAAIIVVHTDLLEENGGLTVRPGASIVIDEVHVLTDATGDVEQVVPNGRHKVRGGGMGFLWSKLPPFRAKQGDSIRVSFQLMPDPRPTIN